MLAPLAAGFPKPVAPFLFSTDIVFGNYFCSKSRNIAQ
jgi:hypothetical protein